MKMPSSLPKAVGRQKEVLYLPAGGCTVVLGTAGSGKTLLAILRARYLSGPKTDHHGRTLLVTFNRCLVTYMKALLQEVPNPLTVENYHHFARGYLNAQGKLPENGICSTRDRHRFLASALQIARDSPDPASILKRPVEFFKEEIEWMQKYAIRTPDDYLEKTRIGRSSVPVSCADSRAVFQVYEDYMRLRSAGGKKYDWDDLASAVLRALQGDRAELRYRHIIVDEGQDFSPEMLRSLAAAVPSGGSLTFFGDTAQQIYGYRMSWREAGLRDPRIVRFEDNYRNSKQIVDLALALVATPYFQDDSDLVRPRTRAADAPLPVLMSCAGERDELQQVVNYAKSAAETGSAAVLFRTREQEKGIRHLLPAGATRLHADLLQWPGNTGFFYGTYHAAKGLEFDAVFLPLLSSGRWPDPTDIAQLGKEEANHRNAKLLYVGITRARSRLVLTYSGQVTGLLPAATGLYRCVEKK